MPAPGLFLSALLPVLLALFAVSCTPNPGPVVRIGTNFWAGYEPLYLARSLEWFKDSRIRLVEYQSSMETMSALRDGSIEAGALTLDEVLSLTQEGVELCVILLMDVSNGADAVVAQAGIRPEDLRGKRIGVEASAVGGYLLGRMLESFGMELGDVQIVPLSADEHEAAFASGKIEAVVTFEPLKSRLVTAGATTIFDSSQIPGEIIDVLAVRAEVLNTSPEALEFLIGKWFDALDYMHKNPGDAAVRMQRRQKFAAQDFASLFEGLRLGTRSMNRDFFDNEGRDSVKNATQLMYAMQRDGLLQHDVNIVRLFQGNAVMHSGYGK